MWTVSKCIFEITLSSIYARLETRCGLVVQFDGNHDVNIRIPNIYGSDTTGMCGNCNGNGGDDLRDFQEFEVVDNSENRPAHCKKEESFHPCEKHPTYRIEGERSSACKVINPASATSTSFSECFKSYKDEAGLLFSSCLYDYCAYKLDGKDGKALEDVLCGDVSAVASFCAMNGVVVRWRTPELCPLPCGANSHYSAEMTACPATCVDRDSPNKCTLTPVEGCECDTGYVLSNERCVRTTECGCTEAGEYYPLGAEFVSNDCSVIRQCKAIGNEMKIVVKERRAPCGTNAECKVQNGQYTCACRARHVGDPMKVCTEITCGANSHYVNKVSPCPPSCRNPKAPLDCAKPMQEGCACNEGFVMNEGHCIRVQDCGCIDDDGKLHRDGTEFVSKDCSLVSQCKAVGNEMKIVVKERRTPCGVNAECIGQNGQYKCVCKKRHTGNPLEGCKAPRECLETLGGSDYRGDVSETVTGKKCRTWNTLRAHRFARLGAHNFCRNPKNVKKAPWCFVNKGRSWEYCDIPMCDGKKPGCIATKEIPCSGESGATKRCKVQGIKYVTWIGQKFPDPKCVFGVTFGRQNDEIWVNGGCGGHFDICYMPNTVTYKPRPTPAEECKKTRKGTEYKGTWGITASGRLCQSWSSQYPQQHNLDKRLAAQSNYCRNPNNRREGPWCFVDDPKFKRKWEYCDILYC